MVRNHAKTGGLVKIHALTVSLVVAILALSACRAVDEGRPGIQFQPLFSRSFSGESIAIVDISDDGEYILAGNAVEKIRYWNLDHRDSPVEMGFNSELIALNFAGKDNSVFFANRVGETRLFDNDLKTILSDYKFPQPARFSRISHDLKLIAYGEYIFYPNRNELSPSTVGHADQSSLQISNQNSIVTSGYHDERLVLRGFDGKSLAEWQLQDPVKASAISGNGDYVVASTENGDCFLWHAATGEAAQRCDTGQAATAIHFDAQGKYFVLVMADAVAAYQSVPFKPLFSCDLNSSVTSSFLGENGLLAIGTDTGDIVLYDVAQGKRIDTVELNKGSITSIDINTAARLLLLGTNDGNLMLFQIR